MVIRDDVRGGAPGSSVAAINAGLTAMRSAEVEVVLTDDFVHAVRSISGEADYHVERNGGQVAARTVTASDGASIVVANWHVLADLSDDEVERVIAHEAGHVSIDSRLESHCDHVSTRYDNHWWNRQVEFGVGIAIDEFRCEAAVYAAGYPVGPGLTDEDVADDLFGLNVQLLAADHEYQSHLDVEQLRDGAQSRCVPFAVLRKSRS